MQEEKRQFQSINRFSIGRMSDVLVYHTGEGIPDEYKISSEALSKGILINSRV